jgi:hypothetical protein
MFRPLLLITVLLSTIRTIPLRADETLPPPAPSLPVEEKSTLEVAPGVQLTTIKRNTPGAPLQMFVVKVDRTGENAKKYQHKLATADYSVLKRVPVSQMAKQQNAVVAINGGYFAFGGAALGAVKVDGEWIRLPMKNRTAVGINDSGEIYIDALQMSPKVGVNFGISRIALPVDNLNGFAPENGSSIVTSRWGKKYKLRDDEVAIRIEENPNKASKVASLTETGEALVPDKGWLYVLHGSDRKPN